MKVSVVIPAHNEENFLGECLTSIVNQVEKADEIIVVNNLSTDKTVDIAKKYNVQVVDEKNLGMAVARSTGFDAASHELIARCDADTIVPPDWIKKIKINFTGKIDALAGAINYSDLNGKDIFNHKLVKLMKFTLGHYPLIGPNMALTKNIWNKVRDKVCLDDSKVHEDLDLSIHINKAGGIIEYDSTLVVKSSARRFKKNIYSVTIEYPIRYCKTLLANHP